jgi:hypothetical protein
MMLNRHLLFALLAVCISQNTLADPLGTEFTYQGQLVQAGSGVTGACDFFFGLWDAEAAGSEVATAIEALNVTVNEGAFTTVLDYGASAFDGNARWLEIAVICPATSGVLTILAPRQRVSPVPQSQYALLADTAIFAEDADTVDGLEATDLLDKATYDAGNDGMVDAAASVPWSGIQSLPADLADGDDVNDADNSATNELQNLFATVTGDTGNTTADTQTDTLNIVGSGLTSTAIAGDTLTITGSGDHLGNHTATQDLDLDTFKLVGNGGSVGISIASDGAVTMGNTITIDGITVGSGGISSDGDVGVFGNVTIIGDFTVTGNCNGCASDASLKQNIRPLDDALYRISQLRGVEYDWRDDVREAGLYPGPQIGVLGQEVEAVFPELVGTDSRGYRFVRYQKLVAPLIEAVKELKGENDSLRAWNEAMERRLETLEKNLD